MSVIEFLLAYWIWWWSRSALSSSVLPCATLTFFRSFTQDSETERLRYMCPRCERSLRPDLNQVLSVLDDLIQALPVERSDNEPTGGEHADGTSSNRIMCLLRLPEFVAVQLLCERAFLFIRQLRETILVRYLVLLSFRLSFFLGHLELSGLVQLQNITSRFSVR